MKSIRHICQGGTVSPPTKTMNLLTRLAIAFLAISPVWAQSSALSQKTSSSTQAMQGFSSFFTARIDVKTLPLAQAIKTVQGNGRRTVYVITDPDCRYCRDLDGALRQVNNVTIYRFEYPLTQLHPNAANIAKQIWCAPDRSQAWEAYAISHQRPSNGGTCANPIDDNIDLATRLGLQGTPDVISGDGRLHEGTMSRDALEKFIDASAI